jgi:NAD(P)H dehydrogenase (quinone)
MATTVVVIFYSRDGETERLAHAAAVGAVQARAGIRLRRMPDIDAQAALERYAASRDTLQRMHREYIAPREGDLIAADGVILASRDDMDASAPEWRPLVGMLAKLHAEGRLAGKAAGVVRGAASGSFSALLRQHGFILVEPDGDPIALGRAVASARIR